MNLSCLLCIFMILFGWSGSLDAVEISTPHSEAELFDLLGKLKNTTLPEARKIERCMRETNGVVLAYKAIKDRYALKHASPRPLAVDVNILPNAQDHDLNLIRNFESLKDENKNFFEAIEAFDSQDLNVSSKQSLAEIEHSIRELQKRSTDLSRRLYPLTVKESQFLYLMSFSKAVIEGYLNENRSLLGMLIGKECQNAAVLPQILALQSDAQNLLSAITQLRDYVLAERIKRDSIVDRLLTEARRDLETQWREEFIRQGKDTLQSIDGTLAVVRLGSVFEEYWITASMNGLADSKHLKYLQYEEPVRLLMIEIQRLKKFEQDFLSIPNAPKDLMLAYANKSISYQNLVRDNLDKLIAVDWRGQLNRQILLNERRKQIADKLSAECLATVDLHLSKSKSVQELPQYRVVESIYLSVVDLCTK